MSASTRTTLADLRRKYAKAFDIPIEDVDIEEWPDEDGCVSAPRHPELPRWTVRG